MSEQVFTLNLINGSRQAVPSITGAYIPPASGTFAVDLASPIDQAVRDQLEDLETIYADPSPQLRNAITVLSEAIRACTEAIDSEESGNRFKADDCILRVQASSPELFSYRSLGDGFGMVASALMFAFVNRRGIPLSKAEMHAVLRTLRSLRSAPFASIETAAGITSILENAGFIVDPLPLTDLLTDAQEAGFVDTE